MQALLLSAAFFVAAASFWLMWRRFPLGPAWRPGVMWVLYAFHMAAAFAPGVVFLFDETKTASLPFFAAVSMTALLIPLGGMLADTMIEKGSDVHVGAFPALHAADPVAWRFTALLCLAGALLACCYVYVLPVMPPLNLFTGVSHAEVMADRKAASGAGYIFGWARVFLMPLMFLCLLLSWRDAAAPLRKAVIALMIAMIFLYNGYTTEKAPVAMLFVLAFFAWFYCRTGRFQAKSLIVPLALGGCIVAYALFVFLSTDVWVKGVGYLLRVGIFDRIFFRPAVNGYFAFEIFPQVYPHTFMQDVQKLARVMDWPIWRLSEEVGYYKYMDAMNAPPPSVGAFYAIAGWPMVILGVLWASFLFRAGEIFLLSRPHRAPSCFACKTCIEGALYILLLYAAFRFSWTSFHAILATEMMVPGLLIYGLWLTFKKYDKYLRV